MNQFPKFNKSDDKGDYTHSWSHETPSACQF